MGRYKCVPIFEGEWRKSKILGKYMVEINYSSQLVPEIIFTKKQLLVALRGIPCLVASSVSGPDGCLLQLAYAIVVESFVRCNRLQ